MEFTTFFVNRLLVARRVLECHSANRIVDQFGVLKRNLDGLFVELGEPFKMNFSVSTSVARVIVVILVILKRKKRAGYNI